MRAIIADRPGAPAIIHDVEVPIIQPDEVLVRVHAASVNPIDWKRRDGVFGQSGFPMILGQDYAGKVQVVGDEVRDFAQGDRVFGVAPRGAYAEFLAAKVPGPIAKIPEGIDDTQAAALPTAGLAALAAVEEAGLRPGQTVLILGATGGVGGFAAQIARAHGATVIATAHSGKEDLARSFGATEVHAYDRGNVLAELEHAHPHGVDAIIDLVGDRAALQKLATVLKRGGHVVSAVGAADREWFQARQQHATNLVFSQSALYSTDGLNQLAELVVSDLVRVRLGTEVPFTQAERVLEESKAGKIDGKAVLTV
jgi:NADPH:quinone reductase-like Zn-dependent oxidoreductase